MRSAVSTLLAGLLTACASLAHAGGAADLVILHAKIWTVDSRQPEAQAVAIIGERIVAVGSDREIEAWRGPATRVVDAGGKRLLPGFNDAHVHFMLGGVQLDNVQLKDAASPEELARRVGAHAASLAPGEWIQGGTWDETIWSPPAPPTRDLIDPVTPNTPVAVNRYDGHMILANSLALKLAGIDARTPDPPGGVIVRDRNGMPTGLLKDAAAELVTRVIPPLSHVQRRRGVERALQHAASLGVTSVQDMNPEYADIAVYAQLLEERKLTSRVYAAPLITQVDDQAKMGLRHAFGGPYLRIGAVKGYADGSLGSSTAYFFEPLSDQPGNRGILSDEMHPISLMRERMRKADLAGMQICTHGIGDAAISAILDLYAELEGEYGRRDRRWRIEHAQHMAPKDFERFARLGVIASMQPYHAVDDGRWAEARIGRDRASRSYAWRSFLDHGVRLAIGTDWFVAPLEPMLTLHAALTRITPDGRHPQGWVPEQRITLAEAIEAYTMGSAYAEFQDRDKGSITPGKLADLVLLDQDVFAIPTDAIRDVKVQTTWVGGVETYNRSRE